jgi:outer membrane protein assembly factor BamB
MILIFIFSLYNGFMGRKKLTSLLLVAVLFFSGVVLADDGQKLISIRSDLWYCHTNSFNRLCNAPKDAGPYTSKVEKLWDMQFKQGVDGRRTAASVIVDGNKTYLFSWDDQASKNDKNKIYCIDTKTKIKIWELETDPPKNKEFYMGYHDFYIQGINATPLLYKNRLLFASVQGLFYNVDAETGKVLWSKKIVVKDELGKQRDYVVQSSPVESCNFVFFGVSFTGKMFKWIRNPKTGLLEKIIMPGLFYDVVRFNLESGEYKIACHAGVPEEDCFRYPFDHSKIRTNLVLYKDRIYVYAIGFMLCADMLNSPSTFGWYREVLSWYPYTCSPSVANDKVFMGFADRDFYCFNSEDGEVLWITDAKLGLRCLTTPAIYKDKIIFGSSDSHVYCLNQSDGEIVWKFKTAGEVHSTPIIAEDMVYVGGYGGRFWILDPETGKLIDQHEVDGGFIKSTLSFADGRLFFGTELGKVYCFGEVPYTIIITGPNNMKVDETCTFSAKALDKKDKDYLCHLKWSLSPPGIAKIDSDFKITALKPGKLTITVSCNGKKNQKVVDIKAK